MSVLRQSYSPASEVVYDCDKYEGTASVTASKRMLKAAGVTIRRYEHTDREVTLVL